MAATKRLCHILVFAYFSHGNTANTRCWPAPRERRKMLGAVPKEKDLFHEMEFSNTSFDDVWTGD
jgi:hypothetical protein